MKKRFLCSLLIASLCSVSLSGIAMAEDIEKFSYLEEMSIEEIKELDAVIHEKLETLSTDTNAEDISQKLLASIEQKEIVGEWVEVNNNHTILIDSGNLKMTIAGETHPSWSGGMSWQHLVDGQYIIGNNSISFIEDNGVVHAIVSGYGAFDGDYVKKEDLVIKGEYSIGETCSTDMIELTITDICFSRNITIDTYLPTKPGSGLVPSDGLTYASISFHVKNVAKGNINYKQFTNFTIDYNDGYEYKVMENGYSYLVKIQEPLSTSKTKKFTDKIEDGYDVDLASLTESDYVINIPCAEIIGTDTESPLKIIVLMPTSTGTEKIVYTVDRTATVQSAETEKIYSDFETIKKVQETLNNKGYDCGVPDGISGSGTKDAIQQYQSDNGLVISGNIDDTLLNSLGI